MGAGRTLTTWGKRGKFSYQGDAERGVRVLFGRGKSFVVPPAAFVDLLALYRGREVDIGASRNPPRDSLGAWLRKHVPGSEVPSAYVGPVLVDLGLAQREGDALRFKP